jgi:uncharacterized protein YqjF (DUF2071 family)
MACRTLRTLSRPFLTARWHNLVLMTFEAPEDLLRSYVPSTAELDRWRGQTHVSLVALQMRHVRVLGWRIPGFATHPQVNFRTYVRSGSDPGVSFVREFVPSRLIAALARLRYREPFEVARIEARFTEHADAVRVEYRFGPGKPRYRVAVVGSREAAVPPASSMERYLTERTHGCREDPSRRLWTFRVEHPTWATRRVTEAEYDVDFAELYGSDWAFLNRRPPVSTILAVGSDVAVYPPSSMRLV